MAATSTALAKLTCTSSCVYTKSPPRGRINTMSFVFCSTPLTCFTRPGWIHHVHGCVMVSKMYGISH
jgi:hypothetical protein